MLGLLIGMLGGGILVYYNSVITNENKISVDLLPQIVKQMMEVTNYEKKNDTLSVKTEAIVKPNTNQTGDKIKKENIAINAGKMAVDTTIESDSSMVKMLEEEEITIKKEELLAEREISIIPIDAQNTASKNVKNDSLLSVISNTKDESKKQTQKVKVELWKSPINYKGYKASKNKIILYGLNINEELVLFSYKDDYILKYGETLYLLDLINEYKNYERISDAYLQSQISKILPH